MKKDVAEFVSLETGRCYTGDWVVVDQEMIDRFADLTFDHNPAHVDPEWASGTDLGGTIAHGFLVLSLLAQARQQSGMPHPPGVKLSFNYGFDRIRFTHPVRSGSRVRSVLTVSGFQETTPGQLREEIAVRVEIEGVEKPAIVASWITMYMV